MIVAITKSWELYVPVNFKNRAFFHATVAGRDFYSHRLGAKRESSALGFLQR